MCKASQKSYKVNENVHRRNKLIATGSLFLNVGRRQKSNRQPHKARQRIRCKNKDRDRGIRSRGARNRQRYSLQNRAESDFRCVRRRSPLPRLRPRPRPRRAPPELDCR
ncbi:hypothetical protein EVAR_41947_1 [Eumeta japonica]|uniref:Uncharacterized protein n=1 Tax=Eumeta variegata TaxID=151549 RepID=A0A4C1XM48_EUMVA|nr:hypothetical protein EVAR_41947_1 [Eumeta japonica]